MKGRNPRIVYLKNWSWENLEVLENLLETDFIVMVEFEIFI